MEDRSEIVKEAITSYLKRLNKKKKKVGKAPFTQQEVLVAMMYQRFRCPRSGEKLLLKYFENDCVVLERATNGKVSIFVDLQKTFKIMYFEERQKQTICGSFFNFVYGFYQKE